jgi:hypothetical protein
MKSLQKTKKLIQIIIKSTTKTENSLFIVKITAFTSFSDSASSVQSYETKE